MLNNNFFVKNGWLGTKHENIYYFYNAIDKQFAVFQEQDDIDAKLGINLKVINLVPEPDFTSKAQAAAITLTTKCNMYCPYCFVKPIKGGAVMSVEGVCDAVRALTELADSDLTVFAWGGEPTQNPEALIALLQEASHYSYIKTLLISNGVIDDV
ncbi:Radical SAM domain protein, partial [Candidatus Magnetomorum sp. HK-1]